MPKIGKRLINRLRPTLSVIPMRGQPGVKNRSDLAKFLRSEYQVFPDAHETIEDMIAEGDKVAVRHKFTETQQGAMGPHPPSGKIMTATYLAIYRLEEDRIVEAWADVHQFSGGGVYLNFAGLGEEGQALAQAAYAPNYHRLAAVKAKYDPTNLFRQNQNIKPASS